MWIISENSDSIQLGLRNRTETLFWNKKYYTACNCSMFPYFFSKWPSFLKMVCESQIAIGLALGFRILTWLAIILEFQAVSLFSFSVYGPSKDSLKLDCIILMIQKLKTFHIFFYSGGKIERSDNNFIVCSCIYTQKRGFCLSIISFMRDVKLL